MDGSKGLRKAIDESFGKYALVQRCHWHKRENVISYLSPWTARSLEEGLKETLILHRLGLVEQLDRSFRTMNLIENLNSQLKKCIGRVKNWMNPDMRSRWMATALLQIQRRMRKVNNYEKLHLLRTALKSELKIKQQKVA